MNKELTIGRIKLKNNILMAPMAGVTDFAFRHMCLKFGAGLVCTEMISSKALYYNDAKTMKLIETDGSEVPFAVQIFGSDPLIMAQTAYKALSSGADILDINMGCPAPKVANNGDGSALLKNPKLIGEIVRAVVAAVDVPVTCKIRSGFDSVADVSEIAKIIEDGGAAAITVHPRTRAMYYSGTANRSIIKKVKDSVKIPVIGNGDIFTAESALSMTEETGCDGVMVARGAQGNPFIFRQINELFSHGKVSCQPTQEERLDCMTEHIKLLIERKGEYVGIREARGHIAWYLKGMRESARMRRRVFAICSADELFSVIADYRQSLGQFG